MTQLVQLTVYGLANGAILALAALGFVRDDAGHLGDPDLRAGLGDGILFLIFQPRGLDHLWRRVRHYFGSWPFRY